jgi:hypothetical protein
MGSGSGSVASGFSTVLHEPADATRGERLDAARRLRLARGERRQHGGMRRRRERRRLALSRAEA